MTEKEMYPENSHNTLLYNDTSTLIREFVNLKKVCKIAEIISDLEKKEMYDPKMFKSIMNDFKGTEQIFLNGSIDDPDTVVTQDAREKGLN